MTSKLPALLATAAALALPLAAQAVTYQFNASLNGASEVPPRATAATGIATLFYDDHGSASMADDTFDFTLSAFNLSAAVTGAHIHAPAPVGVNAPIVVPLDVAPFVLYNSGGTALIGGSGVAAPSATFLGQLQAGLAYANVHTSNFPGGEIRGQLLQVAAVPEPATFALMLAGLGAVGWMARRRQRG